MERKMMDRIKGWRGWDWVAPLAAAFGLFVLFVSFVGELHDYRRSVIGWASRDLAVRTELAAATLEDPLATSDFRRIHAFGDACVKDGVRLTVLSDHGGTFFDTLRKGADDAGYMYESAPCGEFSVRLGLPLERVLAPVNRAQKGLALAGCLGGFAVLIVFFFTYRQRVRIRELARLEAFRREFVSDVSHEIKTPLTGILGAVDLLEGDSPLVPLIRRESKRLNALVQSILDLARLEQPDRGFERLETDLVALVQETVRECGPAAEAKGVRLTLDEPPLLPVVQTVNPQLLSQALSNLVLNAVRHSGAPEVFVALKRTNGDVRIVVEDHGIGIPSEHRTRVFERFHRVDPARAAESGGAGLGLAIVRRIAQLHGGDVTLEAVEPSGCRFTLAFPRTS